MECVEVSVQWRILGRAIVNTSSCVTHEVYVLCNIVARSRYHCCSGSTNMLSVCVVEMHVAVNCINILCIV